MALRKSILAAQAAIPAQSIRLAPVAVQQTRCLSTQSYTQRMANTGRPVSPHVTIYKFPVTALSSIANRGTGVAMAAGTTVMALSALTGGDLASSLTSFADSSPFMASILKFGVAFPITYHYIAGARHLYWDMVPESLTNEGVEKTSYLVFGAAAALSAGAMVTSIGSK